MAISSWRVPDNRLDLAMDESRVSGHAPYSHLEGRSYPGKKHLDRGIHDAVVRCSTHERAHCTSDSPAFPVARLGLGTSSRSWGNLCRKLQYTVCRLRSSCSRRLIEFARPPEATCFKNSARNTPRRLSMLMTMSAFFLCTPRLGL